MKNQEENKIASEPKTGEQNKGKHQEIKTDFPLSEKDEVKQAEEKLRSALNKNTA